MEPFLKQLAKSYYTKYGTDLHKILFLFPNKRSGKFFYKYLNEVASTPIFAPDIKTISEFVYQISGYDKANQTELLFILYDEYLKIIAANNEVSEHTDFDKFVFWGNIILSDFNDVDKDLGNPKQIFSNIKDLKNINYDYLTDEQIAVIKKFWANINIDDLTSRSKNEFISLWDILYKLYEALQERLNDKNIAYDGMASKKTAEILACNNVNYEYERFAFIGFNMLSKSEEKIFKYFSSSADYCWDFCSSLLQNKFSPAYKYIKQNLIKFPQSDMVTEQIVSNNSIINIYEIPSYIGQAKYLPNILNKLLKDSNTNASNALDTAIVLPDENFLYSVLSSIPPEFDKINITLGYPMKNAGITSLMENILNMQLHIKNQNRRYSYYHSDVELVLNHPLMHVIDKKGCTEILNEMAYRKMIFADTEYFTDKGVLANIFKPLISEKNTTVNEIKIYINYLLEHILEGFNDKTNILRNDLDEIFIAKYFKVAQALWTMIDTYNAEMSVVTVFKLLQRISSSESVDFDGDPLIGLQIMGVLETRNLDFKNLTILSMNEGIFPKHNHKSTFIPNNLRKGFGLTTHEHFNGMYSYYFYRMISRSENINLIYANRGDKDKKVSPSRYLMQLMSHYKVPYKFNKVTIDLTVKSIKEIVVQKTPRIMAKLMQYTVWDKVNEKNNKYLSASSINSYIKCPLSFYFSQIENIYTEDEFEENIRSSDLGTLFHSVMKQIYERLTSDNNIVTIDRINAIEHDDKQLTKYIEIAFAEDYFKTLNKNTHKGEIRKLTGEPYLIGEIIKYYVIQTLKRDKKYTPFTYLNSEEKIIMPYTISDSLCINLKAYLDRIDRVNGTLRIVDYKTGSDDMKCGSAEDLLNGTSSKYNKAITQLMLYCNMYAKYHKTDEDIQPLIYQIQQIDNNEDYVLTTNKVELLNYKQINEEFKIAFNNKIESLFDEKIAFTQTSKKTDCNYCNFKSICGR